MATNKLLMKYLPPIRPDGSVRFGNAFPVGSADSGTLTMRVEMLGIKGMDVIYTDTLEYVIVPCA